MPALGNTIFSCFRVLLRIYIERWLLGLRWDGQGNNVTCRLSLRGRWDNKVADMSRAGCFRCIIVFVGEHVQIAPCRKNCVALYLAKLDIDLGSSAR